MKYAWIREHRDSFPSPQSAKCSKSRPRATTPRWNASPARGPSVTRGFGRPCKQVHAESHGIYGSVKIAQTLQQRDDLEHACRNTVAKAMRELGLKSRVRQSFTPTTTRVDPTEQPAPNTLAQDFTAAAAQSQMGDRHHVSPTEQGWVYLAVVLDLFSRKAVGWAIGASLETELVSTALRSAIEARRPEREKTAASQRSRLSVHQRRLPANPPRPGHRVFHEPHGLLLRQRRHGTVLLVAEARMDQA